ncbi:hypothetical protein [Pontiella sulfatireligans]|uniref:hypothetical protein n=1 Tax=Pontiella sulfatireligans TaxID=2750658 RepID=UPI0014438F4A|nr:hypothetical protein [Pontiella sulfatireligans]
MRGAVGDDRPYRDYKMMIMAEDLVAENAVYPQALEKLARMRKRLQEHGFTSFAEA